MRLRNIKGAENTVTNSILVEQEPEKNKGEWHRIFSNNNPIHMEIGMGKGQFITKLAEKNPNINYIGMEKYSSVLLRALQKLGDTTPENLRFICEDARTITEMFGEGEVNRIYLNFSDPWPKDRHAKRRLPSREFLKKYDLILSEEGHLEFKTDNSDLFQFALEELEPAGWYIVEMTKDLHHDSKMAEGNVMTEYEEKFSAIGNPIYKYIIAREQRGKE